MKTIVGRQVKIEWNIVIHIRNNIFKTVTFDNSVIRMQILEVMHQQVNILHHKDDQARLAVVATRNVEPYDNNSCI